MTKGTEREVNRRIALAWKKYWGLKHIMKGPYKIEQKSEIFNSCVLPTLTYGVQTWAMTKKEEEKIRVTQNAMERSMLGVKPKDKIKMEHIKKKLNKNNDLLKTIR